MLGRLPRRGPRSTAHLLTALALSLIVACDRTTEPKPTIVGSYAMTTLNGQRLPFTMIQVGLDKFEVLSATMTFANDGRFVDEGTYRVTEDGQESMQTGADTGTYTLNANALTLRYGDGDTVIGTWTGADTISLSIQGFTAVYARRSR